MNQEGLTYEEAFLTQLRALVGPSAVQSGESVAAHHLSDWSGAPPVRPLALVFPGDTEAVSRVMALCHTYRVPVVPQGGLTGMAGGAVPVAGGIALSLSRMNAIAPVDVTGATLTVQAGATLQAVQEAALAADFAFGVDLGARGSCQIGGNLSTNAGGNGVVQFGMMREQTLGLEVVLANGTVLPMLRPMFKNNTGYDLKHWFIGSEGTLGVITAATMPSMPTPSRICSSTSKPRSYAAASWRVIRASTAATRVPCARWRSARAFCRAPTARRCLRAARRRRWSSPRSAPAATSRRWTD